MTSDMKRKFVDSLLNIIQTYDMFYILHIYYDDVHISSEPNINATKYSTALGRYYQETGANPANDIDNTDAAVILLMNGPMYYDFNQYDGYPIQISARDDIIALAKKYNLDITQPYKWQINFCEKLYDSH